MILGETAVALTKEIGSYFLDRGDYCSFMHWYRLGDGIIKRQTDVTSRLRVLRLRLDQHLAFAEILQGRSDWEPRIHDICQAMVEFHFTSGVSTVCQHVATAFLAKGDIDSAEEELDKLTTQYGTTIEPLAYPHRDGVVRGTSWWTFPRLLLTKADIELRRNNVSLSDELVDGALRIVEMRGVRALGAMPFASLERFTNSHPNDRRLSRRTRASSSYRRLASRVFAELAKRV